MTSEQRPLTLRQAWLSYFGREIKRRREREKIVIPNDIVEEILLRLPVIWLLRYQLVSKHWEGLIRSRDFGERYISHEKTKDPKLLFICDDFLYRSKNTLFIKTMGTLGETMTASLEHRHALEFEEFRGFLEISESCDGLVCIYAMTIPVTLMDPASALSISLPLAKIQRLHIDFPNPDLEVLADPDPDPEADPDPDPYYAFTRFGFGKDSVKGRYKLVWLYNKYPTPSSHCKKMTRCEVLDLEDKRWRFVTTAPLAHHHIFTNQRPAFANGSFYWLTGDEQGYPSTQTKLIVFDIHKEVFQLVSTPPFITRHASPKTIGLCNLDGRLCISELKGDCKQEFWWSVDDNMTTWEKIFTVDLRSTSSWFCGLTSQLLTPLAILRDHNRVILSLRDQHNLVAFDLDPKSAVYHLYFSGYYGLAVPYFPSLLLFHSFDEKENPFVPLDSCAFKRE